MGLNPDTAIDLINAAPFAPAGWDIRTHWSMAGGQLFCNRLTAVENGCRQYNVPFIVGNMYTLTVFISSINFIQPLTKGVIWGGAGHSSPVHKTVGIKTSTWRATSGPATFSFRTNSTDVGDKATIDYAILTNDGDYIGDFLGIDWPRVRRKELFVYAGTRRNQRCASRNAKTNCLVAFDV